MAIGVRRIFEMMKINAENVNGNRLEVYSKFKDQVEKCIKDRFNGKYFLDVIDEDQEPSGVVDGKIPLAILKTRNGEFYPIRLRIRRK